MTINKIIPAMLMGGSVMLGGCFDMASVSDKLPENGDELVNDVTDAIEEGVSDVIDNAGETENESEVEETEEVTEAPLIHVQSVANKSLCMTIAEGQLVNTQNCNNSMPQQWRWDNMRLISAENAGLCLDSGDGNSYTVPSISACNDSESQRWSYDNLVLSQQGKALDLNRDNNRIIIYPYHGFENQQWRFVAAGSIEETGGNEASNNGSSDDQENKVDDTDSVDIQTKPCPAGSEIVALTPHAGIARMGSVFSKTLYNPNDKSQSNNSHQPQQIRVQVNQGGSAISGCEVDWVSEGNAENGWVFPDRTTTDDNGTIAAWWTAGTAYDQTVYARIKTTEGEISQTSISGSAQPHETRSNSIHINWSSGTWDHFSVDVTPITLPETTYYSTINFPGGYTGLQTNKILFSVWDVDGVDAQIVDPGIATCEGFGGEGTGAKCYIPYAPETGTTYRFEVEVSHRVSNRTDYIMYFTDMSNGDRTRLAHLRYGRRVHPQGAAGFVEDWWQTGNSCLETEERSVYFHNVRYKLGSDAFKPITNARGTAVYNQWHNEICANYSFRAEDGKFLWSSGGKDKVGRPQNLPNSSSFSSTVSLFN